MTSVLLIEHEPAVAELARRYLARERFAIRLARTPSEAAAALAEAAAGGYSPDAVVLDLTMPGLRAREIRRALIQHAGKPGTGTAAGQRGRLRPARPLVGLAGPGGLRPREAGVPESSCLRRPFGPRSLVVSVHAALAAAAHAAGGTASTRRSGGGTGSARTSSTGSGSASSTGTAAAPEPAADRDQVMQRFAGVALTATERELLIFLVSNPGRVFTRERLLAALRGADAAAVPGTIHPGGYRAGPGGHGSGAPATGLPGGGLGGMPGGGPRSELGGRRNGPAGPRAVDVYVAQLRAKLGDRSPIRTVRGVGYAAHP